MTPDEARRIVLAKYPNARLYRWSDGTVHIGTWIGHISRCCKTEQSAWISAARRIERERQEGAR